MSNIRNIIESELNRVSLFKSKEKLYPEYLPSSLPHRENELKILTNIFKPMLLTPGTISHKAMIVGGIGTGKTVTARMFGKEFTQIAKKRGLNTSYVHVNCHRDRTLFEVVNEVVRQLRLPVPQRGLSVREVLNYMLDLIDGENLYVIVALDEFDYFINVAGSDAVYFLIRVYDEFPDKVKRLNFMFISKSATSLSMLDPTTESYLMKNLIMFNPYRSHELYDILRLRAEESIFEGAVSDDVLKYISDAVGSDKGGPGNARAALEILLIAGEIAEREGLMNISLDHVRKACSIVEPNAVMLNDTLPYLSFHELLTLKAIATALAESGEPYVNTGVVEEVYSRLCEEYGIEPRKHTKLYEYIVNLRKLGILISSTSLKGRKGRSTYISISLMPLDVIKSKVDELLKVKVIHEGSGN
ncbi:MAG: ORC1-type DNA replication protein [Sulfolobales archaeon]|nr:ORC1-type DNA replication protein [Sulfolobales archaeon]MCX8185611.1 ORC1-type DNA replication protein [Sulfolobales archaeon]MDW7969554.1 ORC1-type DNA replication protein [Sulfolobales archaeon]